MSGWQGDSDREIIREMGEETIHVIKDLNESTAKFNKSTIRLNHIMIWLTGVLVLLTGVLVWLTIVLIMQ